MPAPDLPSAGRLCAAVVVSVMCLGSVSCTSDEPPAPTPAAPTTSTTTPSAPAVAPLDLQIASVAGRLPRNGRLGTRNRVTRTVDSYVEAAFLGDFPRTTYDAAFARFTPAARARAQRDRALLTHGDRGARLSAVVPVERRVRVDVFAPRGRALGATARMRLVLDLTDEAGATQRVRIAGRLLLSRAADNSFRVIGYDVRRTTVPVPAGDPTPSDPTSSAGGDR